MGSDVLMLVAVPAAILGAIGLLIGLVLTVSSKVFAVPVDERVTRIQEVLPGVNCGACGQAGCSAFAAAVVAGTVEPNGCPVGGAETASKVAAVLGIEVTNTVSFTARVFCGGNRSCARDKYAYDGIPRCSAASALHNGPKACPWSCLGFGDCVEVCPFDAIVIEDGLTRIVESKCRSCEACVAACPKKLISMVPRPARYAVLCKNTQKGPVTKKACDVGCIGCGKCVKVCPHNAITLANNLATIDPLLCQNCAECVAVCPTKSIVRI